MKPGGKREFTEGETAKTQQTDGQRARASKRIYSFLCVSLWVSYLWNNMRKVSSLLNE